MQCNRCFVDASPALRFIPTSTAMLRSFTLMLLLLLTACLLCSAVANTEEPLATIPAIIINPTVGPPTTNVLVAGSGFDPYAAVDIYFDLTDLALAVTDGKGVFGGIAVQVPASAVPGKHWITAVERYGIKAAQKPFLVRTDWAQFRFGPDHNGVNPFENVLNPQTVGSLALDWSYSTPIYLLRPPIIASGLVYICGNNYTLYALNAATGGPPQWTWSLCWSFGDAVDTKANVLYDGSNRDSLYFCDATTGAFRGEQFIHGTIVAAPTVDNGTVYFTVAWPGTSVYAFDTTTLTIKWTHATGGEIFGSPTVANGIVYAASNDGYLYALNAHTGALVWKFATTGAFWTNAMAAPAVANGVVYFPSWNGYLYAFDANNGTILWQRAINGIGASSPALVNGVVYVGSLDGNFYAVSKTTGELLWQFSAGGGVWASPAVANGVVYVGSLDGNIYALNASTGALLWQYATGASVYSSPAVVNGILYTGSENGNVYAFSLPSGEISQKFSPPERPDPKLLLPDLSLRPSTPVTRMPSD